MIRQLRVNSTLQDQMIEAIESAKAEFKLENNYIVVLGDDGHQYANVIDKVFKDGFLSGGVFYPFIAFKKLDALNAEKIRKEESTIGEEKIN